MKIGIVSLYYNNKNIGGLLQSYAMTELLRKLGHSAEQICYDLSVSNNESKLYQKRRKRVLLLYSGTKIVYNKILSMIKRLSHKDEDISSFILLQNAVFDEFEKFVSHSTEVYNINTINKANKKYDAFIVGSDQVWNLGLLAHDAMYLTFVDKGKKQVTYAVSMGKASITNYEKSIFLKKIGNFSEIAVREASLGRLISSISTKECINVLDPTLLLNYEQWKNIENTTILPNERYVFCYFLGDCKWQRIKVQEYADSHGLKIIDIPYITGHILKSDALLSSEKHCDVGPREFLSLVKNATCVFTDSFHAVAFSVNFFTDFYVFDRDGLSGSKSINSRITDFLDMLGLTERRITSKRNHILDKTIEWDNVNNILEKQRYKSITWLLKQLSN